MSDLPAYATTTVPVERSQAEIASVLRNHHAESFQFGEGVRGPGQRYVGVEFTHHNYKVIMVVPVNIPSDAEATRIERAVKRKRGWLIPEEWALARTWRIVAWTLRSRLIGVEEGVETFEQAFLPHIVNPESGRTIYSELAQFGRVELPEALPLLPAGGEQ